MPRRGRSKVGFEFGMRMQSARESLGLSQKEVADAVGITTEAYGSYERGWRVVPLQMLPQIARVLNRSLYYMFGLPEPQGLTEDEALLLGIYRQVESEHLRRTIRDVAYNQLQVEQSFKAKHAEQA